MQSHYVAARRASGDVEVDSQWHFISCIRESIKDPGLGGAVEDDSRHQGRHSDSKTLKLGIKRDTQATTPGYEMIAHPTISIQSLTTGSEREQTREIAPSGIPTQLVGSDQTLEQKEEA